MAIETWERYGPLLAGFVEWDDEDNDLVTSGGQMFLTDIIRAEITRKLGQMTRGRMTLLKTTNWAGLVVAGRIVGLSQEDKVLHGETGQYNREMGSFLVQDVREKLGKDGKEMVEVSGLGQEHLLTKVKVWTAIGEETTYDSYLTVAAPAPWTTTVGVGAPSGNDSVSLDDNAGVEVGDEIRIQMDTTDWFIGTVTGVDPPGAPNPETVQFTPRIPGDASAANDVEFRKGRLTLAGTEGFAEGQRVIVELDAGPPHHTTVIASINPGTTEIELREGLPSAAAEENIVQVYDYSQPATDDVTQIIALAGNGWTVSFDTGGAAGTENGTAHAPYGESVWDLLTITAEQTGEMFRPGILIDGYNPQKRIHWFRDYGASGVALHLRDVQANLDADQEDADRGVVYSLTKEKTEDLITRVYPVAGDGRIDLEFCTAAALSAAAAAGFSVTVSTDLFSPDYVEYDAGVASHGVLEATFRFGNVALPRKASLAEMQQSADAMLKQAMNVMLESQTREYWRCECQTHRPLYPGQTIQLNNYTGIGPASAGVTYYILEVTERYEQSVGVITTSLLLSTIPKIQPSPVRSLANSLKATDMAARRQSITTGEGTVVIGTGGGGEGGDHGGLTGLSDDDHAQYLPVSGARAMAGNLTMPVGATVDGVDVSAHAANPAAHHDPVSIGNTGLTLTGQQVSLRLRVTLPGLEIVDGLRARVNSNAGIEIGNEGLGIKRPTNSGVGLDGSGLYLSPAGISATSANGNTGITHTHAADATDNAVAASVAMLLKSSATGALSLDRLGVGIGADNAATLKLKARATANYTLWMQQLSGQTSDMWRIENSAGNPLIRLTGGGNLESGTPAFVSGLTGWRIEGATGNAEFNNIVARGEFRASVFTTDELHATGGTLAVLTATKVTAPVGAGDNQLPAALGSTFTINVQAQHTDPGGNYFTVNDVIRLKWIRVNLGGSVMDGRDVYLQVTAIGTRGGRDLANNQPGYYPMTVRWLYGGETTYTIPTGTAAVKWGRIGQTANTYTGGMYLTADLTYAPYIDIFTVAADQTAATWQAGPVTPKPRMRIGNLHGILGKAADEWGMAAGNDLSDANATTARYIVASDAGIDIRNAGIKIFSGNNQTVDITSSGEVKYGTNVTAADTTLFHFSPGTGALRLGPLVANKPNFYWDGVSALHLRMNTVAVITLDGTAGASYFAGRMTIGPNGEILQGSGMLGTVGSWPTGVWGTFTGLRIGRDSGGIGRLATYNAGVAQVALNSTGQLIAGGGDVVADAAGLQLRPYVTAGSGYFDGSALTASLRWRTAAGTVSGYILSRYYSATGHRSIWVAAGTNFVIVNNDTGIEVRAANVFLGNSAAPGTTTNYGALTVGGAINGGGTITAAGAIAAGASLKASSGLAVGSIITGNPGSGITQIQGISSHPAAPMSGTVQLYVIATAVGGGTTNYTLYMQKPSGARVAIATV